MHFIKKNKLYLGVICRLGLSNVVYVAWYRFSLKTGIRRYLFPKNEFYPEQDFFYATQARTDYPEKWLYPLIKDAARIVKGNLRYYARHWKDVGSPPDWFLNPFNQLKYPEADRHWTELPDFHPEVGDIKNVWEASRFEWVVTLARAYKVSGESVYLKTLNAWLKDWTLRNSLNSGPNWKCGQEAAIRVFNLMQAALILNQWQNPSPALHKFLTHHLGRIKPNIRYAVAQDNNHGTSEATALFIGGNWLINTGAKDFAKAFNYASLGRKILEDRVKKLVDRHGSFSQHSLTYHRVLLDTLCFAEIWRKKMSLAPFSQDFYQKARAASNWLWTLSDETSGGAPNLGSNDGALFLNCHSCDYRDFRPSIQLDQALFKNRLFFADGPWNEPLYWFGLDKNKIPLETLSKEGCILDQAYACMRSDNSWGLLRMPRYRFRPGHNDVFHFDLWYKGENICRDGGNYSYNPENSVDAAYFKSVEAHNTVSFDQHEQMPRLGRFMLGAWIRPEHIKGIEPFRDNGFSCSGSYMDYQGNRHQRTITCHNDEWSLEDILSGSFDQAQVRFRLIPGNYMIKGNKVIAPWGEIEIQGSHSRIDFEKGFESLYYWEKEGVPILTISVGSGKQHVLTKFVFGCPQKM